MMRKLLLPLAGLAGLYAQVSPVGTVDALGSRLTSRVPNPFQGLIPAPSPLAGETITVAQLLAPYPQFTAVSLQRNTGGDSYYHSLQTSVNKRFSAGLTFQFAYTWSRLLEKLRFIEPSDWSRRG
jgi:hypothetical protein